MSIRISDVVSGLATQQIHGLILVLKKSQEFSSQSANTDADLLATRLHPDMHPLSWQLNTTLELLVRGTARLSGAEVINLDLDEDNFRDLIKRIETIQQELLALDPVVLDRSEAQTYDIPAGPDTIIPMTGKEYVLKFLLPNFYFHMTTSYDLLRMSGVPLGKRDYLGVS